MRTWWRELGAPGRVLLGAFGVFVVCVALLSVELRKMVKEQRAARDAQKDSAD